MNQGPARLQSPRGLCVPGTQTTLNLVVNNVFDAGYRSFVGVPRIGRFAMLSARYEIF